MSRAYDTLELNSRRRSANTEAAAEARVERQRLSYANGEIFRCLGFLLSMSMIGLDFPLGFLLVPVCMLSALKNDRYDFIIMVTIFLGGYDLVSTIDLFFDPTVLVCAIGIISMLLLRKNPILKKVLIAVAAYFIALLVLALQSDESLRVQSIGLRDYMSFVYVFFPFVVFSSRDFDIMDFFRKIFLYGLVLCSFYVIDSVILGGALLLPRDSAFVALKIIPTFYDPYIHPIVNAFLRRWPMGLYPLALCVYPMMRYYKLSFLQWMLIICAFLISRTFVVTLAFGIGAVLSLPDRRKVFRLGLVSIGIVTVLYFVDGMMGEWYISDDQGDYKIKVTNLRVKSQIDQVLMLDLASGDEEALAAFGTGRGAQIIPKLDLIFKLGKEWTGLGFLNRELTKNKKYIIDNELYNNPEVADEVAIGVESAPFDIFLTIGYLGLIVHTLFWVWLWFIIRKLKYSGYFVITAIIFALVGIGGRSLNSCSILLLVSLSYAAVIMANKKDLDGFASSSDNNFQPVAIDNPTAR